MFMYVTFAITIYTVGVFGHGGFLYSAVLVYVCVKMNYMKIICFVSIQSQADLGLLYKHRCLFMSVWKLELTVMNEWDTYDRDWAVSA